ncbi:MAG: NAD+ synthase [Phycisphaerae bacterium]|nr:NAD+ synthase [Phycisphaerae bacterium]
MIVALAQINPLVGDLAGNSRKILDFVRQAQSGGATAVLFPELSICGYPPKDLLLKESFIDAGIAAVHAIASEIGACIDVFVGCVDRSESRIGRPICNSLWQLRDGAVIGRFHKSLLPTYDVFDEHRYFEPSDHAGIAELRGRDGAVLAGITICEDLWTGSDLFGRSLYRRAPVDEFAGRGIDLILNASASPYVVNKQKFREHLMAGHARAKGLPLLLAAQVGGNDELVFDGASMAFDGTGKLIARARAFAEDLLFVDIARPELNRIEPYPDPIASVWDALVLGTRDYVRKCGFREVVIGLSGGIDSAVTAAIATEALGSGCVHGVAMPSRYSSEHSVKDSEDLAANLAIDFRIVPIGRIHDMFDEQLVRLFVGRKPDTAEENVQARIRGAILMALSNKFEWLLLTTGNKSEIAVGYCTLYGDMCGGLAALSDVPKTMVYQLANHANTRAGRDIIPRSSITKPPSAELRPDQTDQDSLPPYDLLDSILHAHVELDRSGAEIVASGIDESVVTYVLRLVARNEYKRQQLATGLKVTSRAFGAGRRMPIAAKLI